MNNIGIYAHCLYCTTINLFVDSDILEDIRKEALSDGVSLNAKVNDILTSYSLLYKYNKEQDAVFITGKTDRFFLDSIDENKLIDHYIEVTSDLAASMLIERNVPFTLDNFIRYIIEGVAKKLRPILRTKMATPVCCSGITSVINGLKY